MKDNYTELVNESIRFTLVGNIPQVINNCKKAINVDPSREEAYTILANAYYTNSDYENAITIYEKCIEINPNNPNHYFSLGRIYDYLKNNSAFNIFHLDQPYSQNEENANACFLMATYLGNEGAKRILASREIVYSSKGGIERKKPDLLTKKGIIDDLILIAQYKMGWEHYRSAKKIFTFILSLDKSNKVAIDGILSCDNNDEENETKPSKTNRIFEKFLNNLSNLSFDKKYRCDVFKTNDQKLINNEKGYIVIQHDKVILETDDESGDQIIFYPKDDELFCKYIVMNDRIIVDEVFSNVEFQTIGLPQTKLNIEINNDFNDGEIYF